MFKGRLVYRSIFYNPPESSKAGLDFMKVHLRSLLEYSQRIMHGCQTPWIALRQVLAVLVLLPLVLLTPIGGCRHESKRE